MRADSGFPGAGRRYRVTFPTFGFEVHFESDTVFTWARVLDDGRLGERHTEAIHVERMGDAIFVVTWREASGNRIVSVQDHARRVMLTNIVRADHSFLQARGTFAEL